MKKFYLLLAVVVALGTAASAQLSKKLVSGKQHSQQKPAAKNATFNSLKKNNASSRSNSTVYWSDDFSNPSTWTLSAVAPSVDNWVIGTNGPSGAFLIDPIASATAANGFALFDSDLLCSGDQQALLTTAGTIDLSAATSARLKFSQYYRRYIDSTYLYVSNNGGSTWNQIALNAITQDNNFNSNDGDGSINPDIAYVDISSLAAGSANVKIRFEFYSPASFGAGSGCGYSWMIDDVSIEDVPADDIGIAEVAHPSPYSCVPLTQVQPLTLGAKVFNNGSSPATNAVVTIDIYDGSFNNIYNSVTNSAATLNPGDTSALLTTSLPFTPSDTGVYYFMYVCSMTNADANTSNDTSFSYMYVDTADYARDFTFLDASYYTGGLGFNANTGHLGQTFEVYQPIQFNSATFYLAGATMDDSMSVDIYDMVGGLPNALIASTGNYIITDADTGGAFLSLPFSTPFVANGGQYYVAVNQKSQNNITLGTASDIFTPGTAFYQVGAGAWTAVETASFEIAFILRVTTADISTGISTVNNASSLTIYPNPSKGQLSINSDAKNALVTITNTLGQVVYSNRFDSMTNAKVDISNQAEGMYTVRVQSAAGVSTKNIMISNR